MFENLNERLERSFKILKGEGKITEINVAETLKDVRRALIDADVNYKVAKTFTDTVKKKALGMNVLTAVKPGQLMVKLVHDELAELMGGEAVGLKLEGKPAIILMSGLQGSGKTTFSGKLANMLKTRQHKNPLLVACDVYRPAAIEQLKVVGEGIGVPVYTEEGIVHYCVANIPGAVPNTSTLALTNATLSYAVALADKGWRQACNDDPALAKGLNIVEGKVVYKAVADVFGLPFHDLSL